MSDAKPQVDDAFALLNAPLVKRGPIAPRSRWVYLALAVTLGAFGTHNWFARRYVSAAVQLCMWVVAFSFFVTVLAVGTEDSSSITNPMALAVLVYPIAMVGWIIFELSSVKECGDGAMLEWSA